MGAYTKLNSFLEHYYQRHAQLDPKHDLLNIHNFFEHHISYKSYTSSVFISISHNTWRYKLQEAKI